jgi:hypothetical protein
MKTLKKNKMMRAARYPGNVNAHGVPLVGQTGKNFHQILSRLSPAERAAFEQLRAQAHAELAAEPPLLERAVGG